MKIAVITSNPLFAEGGHVILARSVVDALREAGHEVDLVRTPQNRFGRQGAAYLATWLTDVGVACDESPVDQVISFRYPSYAVRHPRHVCWLNHRMREYYDLWERFIVPLKWKGLLKERVRRRIIHAVDRYLLTRNVSKLYTISATIQQRLQRFGAIPAEVLYPPAPPRPYRCEGYGDEFFAVSRLTPLKRLDLIVRACGEPGGRHLRCTIAGDGEDAARLQRLARDLGVEDRVRLVGSVDTQQLVEYLGRCRAVVFPTMAEDYGLVTVEAFASRKAVITCLDSGGPAELVRHRREGFVVDPTPSALASAMAELAESAALAEQMGTAAAEAGAAITWPRTLDKLLLR
ncbi:MAG: glycosyltransferase family 4 protein [Acidobacteriota bacterium]